MVKARFCQKERQNLSGGAGISQGIVGIVERDGIPLTDLSESVTILSLRVERARKFKSAESAGRRDWNSNAT